MQVCLVGSRQYTGFGDQGTSAYVNFRHFDSLEQCCLYLKKEQGTIQLLRVFSGELVPLASQ